MKRGGYYIFIKNIKKFKIVKQKFYMLFFKQFIYVQNSIIKQSTTIKKKNIANFMIQLPITISQKTKKSKFSNSNICKI